MATTIKLGITPESAQEAKQQLASWYSGKFLAAVDSFMARTVVGETRDLMSGMAHVGDDRTGEAGTLKKTISSAPATRLGFGFYWLTVDAYHPSEPDGHYAAVEQSRSGSSRTEGTSHDFTADNHQVAEQAAYLWEERGYKGKL